MRYPGGKNLSGCYQRIISQIPPHRLDVEPFAGSAAIARLKRPARQTVLIDLDPGAIAGLGDGVPPGTQVLQADGIAWLEAHAADLAADACVYADPPYLPETCGSRPPMGRVVAEAVLSMGPRDAAVDCRCGCGRLVPIGGRQDALPACRKRLERARRERRSVVTWS